MPTVLYGTINGVLGVVASLPAAQYAVLEGLQAAMRKVVRGVGGLDHAQVCGVVCSVVWCAVWCGVVWGREAGSAGGAEPSFCVCE